MLFDGVPTVVWLGTNEVEMVATLWLPRWVHSGTIGMGYGVVMGLWCNLGQVVRLGQCEGSYLWMVVVVMGCGVVDSNREEEIQRIFCCYDGQ